jgi:hypothetical protein
MVLVPTENTAPAPRSPASYYRFISIAFLRDRAIVPGDMTALTYSNCMGETGSCRDGIRTVFDVLACAPGGLKIALPLASHYHSSSSKFGAPRLDQQAANGVSGLLEIAAREHPLCLGVAAG